MMNITLKQIEIFVAIAKSGNMNAASEYLHLTQSACSMALAKLETQLNTSLYDRHGKKLVLNEQGRLLLPKVTRILTEVEELKDLLMAEKNKTLTGQLVVGASTTIGNYLLPSIIGNFIKVNPHVKLSLRIANTEKIIQELRKFNLDIAMIEGNCYADDINVLSWKKDELIIIAAPTYLKKFNKKITPKNIFDARWILREPGSGTREKFEEAIGEKIYPFLELGSTEAIKQAVLEGHGISCVSRITVRELLKNKQVIEVKTPYLKLIRDFYLLLHKEKYHTSILQKFMDGVL